MGKFLDYLDESFDLNSNYKKLSTKELDNYWVKILQDESLIPEVHKRFRNMNGYVANYKSREYFIYTYYNNMVFEVHFYDMDNLEDEDIKNIGKTPTSQGIFSIIMTIIIKSIEGFSPKIVRVIAPKNKEKFYVSIINKILKKYKIDREIQVHKTKDGAKIDLISEDYIKNTVYNLKESLRK